MEGIVLLGAVIQWNNKYNTEYYKNYYNQENIFYSHTQPVLFIEEKVKGWLDLGKKMLLIKDNYCVW